MKNLLIIATFILALNESFAQVPNATDYLNGTSIGYYGNNNYVPGPDPRAILLQSSGVEDRILGVVGFTRKGEHVNSAIYISATMLYMNDALTQTIATSGEVMFQPNDFAQPEGSATATIRKEFQIVIPGAVQKGNGYAVLQYKIKIGPNGTWSDPVFAPVNQNRSVVVSASIAGSNQICSEETYTITNPGTITLENANGIANLTALGDNRWKINRMGSATGKVLLKSTNGQLTNIKEINIGSIAAILNGPSIIRTNGTFNYSISGSANTTNIQYSVMAPNGVEFTPVDGTNFSLNVTTPTTGGSILMVRVTITTNDICGTNQYIKNIGVQL